MTRPRIDPATLPEWCICSPDFYERGLYATECRHDEIAELIEDRDRWKERARIAEEDADRLYRHFRSPLVRANHVAAVQKRWEL